MSGVLMTVQQARSQALYGSLVGTVTDASNAAVPGAAVRITRLETNESREATTNQAGVYNFPSIPSGTYDVVVSKDSFKTFTERGVVVSLSSVVRVDGSLQVGSVSESVQVGAQAAALQTDRAEVRSELSTKQLEELPVPANRNYQNLFVLIPGFTPPTQANSLSANPTRALNFNVNGTTRNSNNTRIDGASATNGWLPYLTAYLPGLESIETVSIVSSSLDAEQGLTGGAAINVQVKSGSNQMHGSLFEYHTDNALKAKPFFLPVGAVKPKYIDNQYGGTIGGAFKKDKIFYFLGFDSQTQRQTAAAFTTVPTAAIRAGDMSASPNPIYDPNSGLADGSGKVPYPNKAIPANLMEPIVQRLLAFLPLPNIPNLLTNNYYASAPLTIDRRKVDGKLNWNTTDKLKVNARWGYLDYTFNSPSAFGNQGPNISSVAGRAGKGYGTVLSITGSAAYLFSPTFLLDSYFGYTRLDTSDDLPQMDQNVGLDYLKIPGTNGPSRLYGGWPGFIVPNYSRFGRAAGPIYYLDPNYEYVANFNWTKGTHNVRFGVDISRSMMNNFEVDGAGNFFVSGGSTTVKGGPSPNQFNTFGDFLMGLLSDYGTNRILDGDRTTSRTWAHSLFVRDQWQVSRKLTMSLGLRWDYFPMGVTKDHGFSKFDFNTGKMLVCGYGNIPRDCGISTPKTNFSPRVGLAYRAAQTFVIRAGFGINYDPQPLAFARDLLGGYPTTGNFSVDFTNPNIACCLLKNGIQGVPTSPAGLNTGIVDVPTNNGFYSPPDKFRMGYIESWNLTMEKQLKGGFIGQVGYVGSRQIKQLQQIDQNVARPGGGLASKPLFQKFGRTTLTGVAVPYGHNSYDSLQATLRRSFSKGVQFQMSYTWSKSIGLCCNDLSDAGPAIQIPEYSTLNKALTSYDRTHVLTAGSVAELPFGKGKPWANGGGFISHLVNGWQINALFAAYSGVPFSVSASGTSLNADGNTQRADQVKAQVDILGGVGATNSYFDPLAFAPVTEPRFGTAGFNTVRGPGLINVDLGIVREFSIGEHVKVQFRTEALNATNTPHFANPGSNVSNLQLNADGSVRNLGGFTVISSTANTGREGIDERFIRFGLRVRF